MKNDVKISNLTAPILVFFRRFHTLLFFLAVSGGLFVAIMMLLSIINLSSSTAASSDNAINGSFDEDTIRRLRLDSSKVITPGSRQSPFVE